MYINKYEDACFVHADEARAKLYAELVPNKFIETIQIEPDGAGDDQFFVVVRADNGYPLLCYKDDAIAKSILTKFTLIVKMQPVVIV